MLFAKTLVSPMEKLSLLPPLQMDLQFRRWKAFVFEPVAWVRAHVFTDQAAPGGEAVFKHQQLHCLHLLGSSPKAPTTLKQGFTLSGNSGADVSPPVSPVDVDPITIGTASSHPGWKPKPLWNIGTLAR